MQYECDKWKEMKRDGVIFEKEKLSMAACRTISSHRKLIGSFKLSSHDDVTSPDMQCESVLQTWAASAIPRDFHKWTDFDRVDQFWRGATPVLFCG